MSRKEQTTPEFHDASDPRCEFHKLSSEPARRERTCLKCLNNRGFESTGVPLETSTHRRRRRATSGQPA